MIYRQVIELQWYETRSYSWAFWSLIQPWYLTHTPEESIAVVPLFGRFKIMSLILMTLMTSEFLISWSKCYLMDFPKGSIGLQLSGDTVIVVCHICSHVTRHLKILDNFSWWQNVKVNNRGTRINPCIIQNIVGRSCDIKLPNHMFSLRIWMYRNDKLGQLNTHLPFFHHICLPGFTRFDSAHQPSAAGISISITAGLPGWRFVFN